MKTYNNLKSIQKAIAETRNGYYPKCLDLTPVIVCTEYSKHKYSIGVQYWNENKIKEKVSINDDRTISHFIENL